MFANNTRNIVKKKNINDEYIFWAYKKKGEWVTSKRTYAKAKLLLTTDWVFNNVPMFAKNNKVKYDIEPAPELLMLDDNEKLTDCDGNIMEIETRGERDVDKCYFKVKDISRCFEMNNLKITLLNNNGYEKNIHYKIFTTKSLTKSERYRSRIFLTYTGLVRCLYVSRNKNADKFQKWASKILFTAQMGSKEQKNELVSKLLGVDACAVKEVFKTSSKTILTIIFDNLRLQAELG